MLQSTYCEGCAPVATRITLSQSEPMSSVAHRSLIYDANSRSNRQPCTLRICPCLNLVVSCLHFDVFALIADGADGRGGDFCCCCGCGVTCRFAHSSRSTHRTGVCRVTEPAVYAALVEAVLTMENAYIFIVFVVL